LQEVQKLGFIVREICKTMIRKDSFAKAMLIINMLLLTDPNARNPSNFLIIHSNIAVGYI